MNVDIIENRKNYFQNSCMYVVISRCSSVSAIERVAFLYKWKMQTPESNFLDRLSVSNIEWKINAINEKIRRRQRSTCNMRMNMCMNNDM